MNFEDKQICYPFDAIYTIYGNTISCSFLRLKKRK
jgi:hypothetical protein